MSKQCALCKRILEDSYFTRNKKNKDGLHSYCKECNAKKAKEYNYGKGKNNYLKAIYKQKENGYFRFGHGAFVNMKKSCEKRKIDFRLSEEELKLWWINTPDCCYYCGINAREFVNLKIKVIDYCGNNDNIQYIKNHVFNKDIYKKIETMTIDRKDSNKGYFIENIVKACWICNSIKGNNISEEEMLDKGKK